MRARLAAIIAAGLASRADMTSSELIALNAVAIADRIIEITTPEP